MTRMRLIMIRWSRIQVHADPNPSLNLRLSLTLELDIRAGPSPGLNIIPSQGTSWNWLYRAIVAPSSYPGSASAAGQR
jgi:hypothetical protein